MKFTHHHATIFFWIGLLAFAGFSAFAYRYYFASVPQQIACTQEAKLCPDGSAVGRIGPNCEFADCPDLSKSNFDIADINWKTYRNEKYGFEVKYPETWMLEKKERQVETIYALTDPNNLEVGIDIYYSYWGVGAEPYSGCPIGTHVVECKELENKFGLKYVREIRTGQLQLDKQQQLTAYFLKALSEDFYISIVTLVTNENGTPLKSGKEIINTFNEIVSTIKFLK